MRQLGLILFCVLLVLGAHGAEHLTFVRQCGFNTFTCTKQIGSCVPSTAQPAITFETFQSMMIIPTNCGALCKGYIYTDTKCKDNPYVFYWSNSTCVLTTQLDWKDDPDCTATSGTTTGANMTSN